MIEAEIGLNRIEDEARLEMVGGLSMNESPGEKLDGAIVSSFEISKERVEKEEETEQKTVIGGGGDKGGAWPRARSSGPWDSDSQTSWWDSDSHNSWA